MNPADAARPRFSLRSLLLPVYLPTLLFAFGEGMTLPVLPLFAQALGASLAVVGVTVTVRGFGALASDIPAGVMVNRFGGRNTMLASAGLAAGSSLAIAFATDTWHLIALMFFFGAGWSMWLVSRLAYVAETVPLEYRGRALSLVGGVNRVGVFAGPIAGGLLAEHLGLEAAFAGQAAAAAVAGAVVLLRREGAAQPVRGGTRVHARLARTLSEFRYEFLTAGTVALILTFVREARQLLIPLWGDHIALGVGAIGLIMGLSSALDMTLFAPVGYVMDRWGRKWTVVPSLALLGASLALLPLAHDFTTLLFVGLLSGFGNGLGSGAVMTLGSDLAPRAGSGEFLGLWRFLTDLGRVAGPTIVGGTAQALALGSASLLSGGFAVAGALVMLLFVAETLQRAPARNLEET